MKALSITLKDLQIFFKDRGALIQLILLPLVFILIFTGLFAAQQSSGEEEEVADNRISLAVVNLDTGGAAAEEFLAEMEASGSLKVKLYTLEAAQTAYRNRAILRLLTIPAGFSQAVESSQPAAVELQALDIRSSTSQSILLAVTGVARDLAIQNQILASLQQMGAMQAGAARKPGAAPNEPVFTTERMLQQARSQFESSKTRPLVAIQQEMPAALQKREEQINMTQLSVPGFTILFAFLAAQMTARSIYEEKKTGSFRRLLAAPLGKFGILSGKLLPNFLIVLVQVLVIFAAAVLVLPLLGLEGLNLGSDPLALILAALLTGLCSTSLGILIAALAHTEGQIGGISALLLWVTGFLGGAIVPLSFLNSPMLSSASRFVPQSWAVQAFQDVLVRGLGTAEILLPLGALLGFSLLFFAVGLWRFEFD